MSNTPCLGFGYHEQCYGKSTSVAHCKWLQSNGEMECNVTPHNQNKPDQKVFASHTVPEIMAPPRACSLEDKRLTCTLKEAKIPWGAVVNFVSVDGNPIGTVTGGPNNTVFVDNACDLQHCGLVKHGGFQYDHFSCKCPRDNSSVA